MATKKHNLTIEEKKKVVQQVNSGELSLHVAAKKYGASVSAIRYWRDRFSQGKLQDRPSKREKQLEKENKNLKEMVGQLFVEIELLKKAEASAQRKKNADSSVITKRNLDQFIGEPK